MRKLVKANADDVRKSFDGRISAVKSVRDDVAFIDDNIASLPEADIIEFQSALHELVMDFFAGSVPSKF